MNRAARRESLFRDTHDRRCFLSLVGHAAKTTALEVHAYCLMGNHYHLLVRTPKPNLDEAMRIIGGLYARHFNDRYDRDGSLCKSRYRSILIDSDRYLLAVSRYIHRNPTDLGVIDLAGYTWSSYSAFLGARPPQEWLRLDETLEMTSGPQRYEALVESPLRSEVDALYEKGRVPSIFGSTDFRSALEGEVENGV